MATVSKNLSAIPLVVEPVGNATAALTGTLEETPSEHMGVHISSFDETCLKPLYRKENVNKGDPGKGSTTVGSHDTLGVVATVLVVVANSGVGSTKSVPLDKVHFVAILLRLEKTSPLSTINNNGRTLL